MKPIHALSIGLFWLFAACSTPKSSVHLIGLDVSGSFSEAQRVQTLRELESYLGATAGHVSDGDEVVLIPIHAGTATAGTVKVRLTSEHKGRRGQNEVGALRETILAAADSLMRLEYGDAAFATDVVSFFQRVREWEGRSGRILVFSDMMNSTWDLNFEQNDPLRYIDTVEPGVLTGFSVRVVLPATAQGTGIPPSHSEHIRQFWLSYVEASQGRLDSWGTNL
jgi:hypothetical protein